MKATVKIRKIFNTPESKIKAIASVILEDLFVVHGVKVIETGESRFLAMPKENRSSVQGENMRRDIFHPISSDARKALEKAVFDAYEGYLSQHSSNVELSK